ncbi:unnamed protein product [Rotaria socialis]|uniref:3CxxC-type domain-containing protein n=1 Tax=Rotaria socialis TaxID=392032 RepID=A0A818CU29_9BILA|nr:unnamed protein product [Rotaria socialis]CAF3427134.1 unnamed protein product [Rotaria socialis]CAF4539237.1 unnamed protein product [Rotaria socialis]CAF4578990.1 unnamed protein product [Rotaria socialis]
MTGPVHQFTRQHSTTSTNSKMDKTYPSETGTSETVIEQVQIEIIPDDGHHEEKLFSKRKNTSSDHDSGAEDIEQQLDDMCIRDENDQEDQSSENSFGPRHDDGFYDDETTHNSNRLIMQNDVELAKRIPDEMKKDLCADTRVACHGEFARLISVPLALRDRHHFRLYAAEEIINIPFMNLPYQWSKVDNAKAQFKCPNERCRHVWTSMRARILFSVTSPDDGCIVLKIFGQNCQSCRTYSQALWYIDEICRVMKNFACVFYENYYPDMLDDPYLQNAGLVQNDQLPASVKRHDPYQRKGKMSAPHVKEYCEACRHGICFI